MKKQVGILSGVGLFALYGIRAQARFEPAGVVVLGGLLLAVANTIRRMARKA